MVLDADDASRSLGWGDPLLPVVKSLGKVRKGMRRKHVTTVRTNAEGGEGEEARLSYDGKTVT